MKKKGTAVKFLTHWGQKILLNADEGAGKAF